MSVPSAVVEAWDLAGRAEPLAGGQGTCVRCDGLVLKPQSDEVFTAWHAQVCARARTSTFELAAPVPARDGRLVVEGWSATAFVTGEPLAREIGDVASWLTVLGCSRAFHAAVAGELRPGILDGRTDRWATADHAAWSDSVPDDIGPRSRPLLQRMRGHVLEEGLAPQLVHGDMAGNVLLSPGRPPVVIDVSPYWRPAHYADAVIVVDALLWWQAEPALVEAGRPAGVTARMWRSLLARALVFRLLAFDEAGSSAADVDDPLPRYDRVLDLLAADVSDRDSGGLRSVS